MKKKNLAILLLLPYLISLLGVITVNLTFKTFENDITHIEWEYSDIEVFKLGEGGYRLNAEGVTSSNYPLAAGNNLVWDVKNQDGGEEPHARIEEVNGVFYLVPLSEGYVTITCSNEKGNISRHTTGIIYLNSVVVLKAKVQTSQNNVDPTVYYGEYDLRDGQKVGAKVAFDLVCMPETLKDTLRVESQSDNLSFNIETGELSILAPGSAKFTVAAGSAADENEVSFSYSFEVVDEGVNVYSYEDLLNCTNRSENGEIVVLRKSFESLTNAYVYANGNLVMSNGSPAKKADNVELFGTYDANNDKYNFDNEVYRFETTYNQSYITQWNEFAKTHSDYKDISNMINVGLRVQKDFYGNGYTINLHNLTFPYDSIDGKDEVTGETISMPYLRSDNLFRGPLPFYTLGDPNGMPLVTAYGQDNIGMYVEGDNILVNDVNIKNCDFGNSFSNLDYVGTVLEIYGDNVEIRNSVMQNGKNVLRAFSSMGTVVDNCMLQNARNFLVMAGCNEYISIDGTKTYEFKDEKGNTVVATLDEFLSRDAAGDKALTSYLMGNSSPALIKDVLTSVQAALNDLVEEGNSIGGSMEINDCLFYRSGITSIALESFFNRPFLYTPTPSLISDLFSMMTEEGGGRPLIPLTPVKVSGVSRPVHLNVSGNTKFYDYKTADEMDLTGLLNENISTIVQSVLESLGEDVDINITIDDIFPLKNMLYKVAAAEGSTYVSGDKTYINIPIAFYGGGLNLSTVGFEGYEHIEMLNAQTKVDWVDSYVNSGPTGSGMMNMMQGVMQKTVTVVTGFDPFQFVCAKGNGYLFGETPNVSELRNNYKDSRR